MPDMMYPGAWSATVVLLWLVVLGLIAAVVLLGYKVMAGPGQSFRESGDDGLRILDERYARGEIDRDGYEERRRRIRTGRL